MRVIKWLDKHLEETILVALLVMIACVMFLQVFMRKVLNSSLSWPEEFCRYCYVWTCFLTVAYTVRYGNMLRVTVVADLFPKTARKIIFILINVLLLVVFGVFFAYSIDVVKTLTIIGQKSTAMRLPMYLVYLCTVLGFGLASLRTIQAIYKQIRDFNVVEKTKLEAAKEEADAEIAQAKADLEASKKKAGG
jgi:TRAP-type C4-dicarboxylate transport system permease small subunit